MWTNLSNKESSTSNNEYKDQNIDLDESSQQMLDNAKKLARLIENATEKSKIEMLRSLENLMISFFDNIQQSLYAIQQKYNENQLEIDQFNIKLKHFYENNSKQQFLIIYKIQEILKESNLLQFWTWEYEIIWTLKTALQLYYESLLNNDNNNPEINYIKIKNELLKKRNKILDQKIQAI